MKQRASWVRFCASSSQSNARGHSTALHQALGAPLPFSQLLRVPSHLMTNGSAVTPTSCLLLPSGNAAAPGCMHRAVLCAALHATGASTAPPIHTGAMRWHKYPELLSQGNGYRAQQPTGGSMHTHKHCWRLGMRSWVHYAAGRKQAWLSLAQLRCPHAAACTACSQEPQWADVVPGWESSSDVLALMKSRGAGAAVSMVQAGACSGTCLIHGCQGAAHSVLGAAAITAQSCAAAPHPGAAVSCVRAGKRGVIPLCIAVRL